MKDFAYYLKETKEFGIIQKANNWIVYCSGLPGAEINEIIIFETQDRGIVTALDVDTVEILMLTKGCPSAGIRGSRTNEKLKVAVGDELLGKVVDPLSNSLLNEKYKTNELRDYDIVPRRISDRKKITRQLETGVSIIDVMLPLGKGQRELVVGDRKTGKTSVILNIVKQQISTGAIVVYGCIGREKSEIMRLVEFLRAEKLMDQTIVVATSSDDPSSLIDLTPYSAMTIAEYFLDQGKDVLVILDDLTTHAKHYREISLLSNRFPGRDSYPGDIFYKHSRLLERAGNYIVKPNGKETEASITCLPIVETLDSRLTDYIVSNLISITDGHILFDVESFNKGRRPAINVFLSVTRVGKQTLSNINRALNRKLYRDLSKHTNAENYQHFGTELSDEFKAILLKGNLIYKFFEQPFNLAVPIGVQAILLCMIWLDLFKNIELDKLGEYRLNFVNSYNADLAVRERVANTVKNDDFDAFEAAVKKENIYFKSLCKI